MCQGQTPLFLVRIFPGTRSPDFCTCSAFQRVVRTCRTSSSTTDTHCKPAAMFAPSVGLVSAPLAPPRISSKSGGECDRLAGLTRSTSASLASVVLAITAVRSHSRSENMSYAQAGRMLTRTSHNRPSGKGSRGYVALLPTDPSKRNNPGARSFRAGAIRQKLKECNTPGHLLKCLESAEEHSMLEVSVLTSAVQKCGYAHWWDALIKVLELQAKLDCSTDTVYQSPTCKAH